MSELYHERFWRITDMLVFPVLLALLLLTLACLAATALALWPVLDELRGDVDAAGSAACPTRWVLATVAAEDSTPCRAEARLSPLRSRRRGCDRFDACGLRTGRVGPV